MSRGLCPYLRVLTQIAMYTCVMEGYRWLHIASVAPRQENPAEIYIMHLEACIHEAYKIILHQDDFFYVVI